MYMKPFNETNKLFLSKISTLYIPLFCDILFLLFYGFVGSAIVNKTSEIMLAGANLLLKETLNTQDSVFSLLFTHPELKYVTLQVMLLLLLYAFVMFLIYTLFHGIAWWWAHDKKQKLTDFLVLFGKINLFWLPFFFIYQITAFIKTFRELVTSPIFSNQVTEGIQIFLLVYTAILLYFVITSYTLFPKPFRKVFKIGMSKLKTIVIPLLLLILGIFLLDQVFRILFSFNIHLASIIGIIILFPLFSWIRIYLIASFGGTHDT